MTSLVLSNVAASITELKKDPMGTFNSAQGEPLVILNRNEPVFYCVPPKIYESMLNMLDDIELRKLVISRKDEESVKVNINEL